MNNTWLQVGAGICFTVIYGLSFQSIAIGESGTAVSVKPPKTAFQALSIFKRDLNTRDFFSGEVVDVDEWEQKEVDEKQQPKEQEEQEEKGDGLRYVSQDPSKDPILAPNETPDIRLNPDAPSPIKGLIRAKRAGNRALAGDYADQYIRLMQNFFFEVRDMTQLIGEALIRQKVIKDDDWVGVQQFMEREFATTRTENGVILKPSHDVAMKRIKADEKNQAEIYYFFTLSCSWCRFMASDVERLWRVASKDPNLKMTALTIGDTPEGFLEDYREHTGLTMPIMKGEKLAKAFNIGFVPAVVIVAPNGNRAYMKSGQQSFARLYEFVKTVQGLPATVTKDIQRLVDKPIGQLELAQASQKKTASIKGINKNRARLGSSKGSSAKKEPVKIERF